MDIYWDTFSKFTKWKIKECLYILGLSDIDRFEAKNYLFNKGYPGSYYFPNII